MKALFKVQIFRVLASLLSITSFIPAYAQNLELTEAEQAWIEAHPVIKVGGEIDWGPFDFVNEQGQHSGISNDYLVMISRRTGLQFEVEPDSWSNLLRKIDRGDIDLLPALFYNEERAGKYHFTSKYYQVTEYVFARDDAGINSTNDLSGKTAAMVRDFASIDVIRQAHPELNILIFDSQDEAINAVITYKADLLFEALATLSFALTQKSISNIHPVFSLEGAKPLDLFMASRKDMPELAGIITRVLENTEESEKQSILVKWLGRDRPTQTSATKPGEPVVLTDEERAWVEQHPATSLPTRPSTSRLRPPGRS